MKGRTTHYARVVALAFLGAVGMPAGLAGAIGTDLGTGVPPGTLGGYTMTPFGADPSALDSLVSSLPSPLGGSLTFSTPVRHDNVANGWATWSHGYQGDVYDSTANVNLLTLGLPSGTTAFYLYAEPNQWDWFNITATTDDGTQLGPFSVHGNGGARGFGFYDTAGSIVSIQVETTDLDFAVGEFAIAQAQGVPDGGSTLVCALLGLFGLCGARLRFRARE